MTDSRSSPASAVLKWRLFWGLAFLEGLLALVWMLRAPSEAERAVWLGLSAGRLAIGGIILSFLAAIAALLLWSRWRQGQLEERLQAWLKQFTTDANAARRIGGGKFVLAAGFCLGMQLLLMTPEIQEPFSRAYFERLLPLIAWGAALCLQGLLLLISLRSRTPPDTPVSAAAGPAVGIPARPLLAFLSLFALVWLSWGWVRANLLPTESLRVGWNRQGVPILETQLALTWLAGMLILVLDHRWSRKRSHRLTPRQLDGLIALALWLITAIVWQNTPLSPNWFISEPRPPNQEIYPNSDALRYDASAQNALDGLGFRFFEGPYIRRPLLSAWITVLHLLRGQNYRQVVSLQVVILALLPALIYLLTRQLAGRAAGVLSALLIMLREANSIAAASRITSSNAKLLMADLPTALMVAAFALAVLSWLRRAAAANASPPKSGGDHALPFALVAGGLLGLSMLIRLETAILGLVALGILALQSRLTTRRAAGSHTSGRLAWKQSALFAVGVILVISPWIVRNYRVTGQVFIDSPNFALLLLAQRFTPPAATLPPTPAEASPTSTPSLEEPPQPAAGEEEQPPSPVETSQAPEIPPPGQAAEQALEFIRENPAALLKSFIAHTLNSEVQAVLTLPTALRLLDSGLNFAGHRSLERFWQECCTVESYIRRLPYWHKWEGYFPTEALLPLAFNLLLISVGLAYSWKKQQWNGLLLFGLLNIYIFLNGAFRNSGGRYLLPVDWVIPIYFSIGLAVLSRRLLGLFLFTSARTSERAKAELRPSLRQSEGQPKRLTALLILLAVGLLVLGSSLPLLEASFPARHTDQRKTLLLNNLLNSERLQPEQRQLLQDFLESGGVLLSGRALYPRYFSPGLDEAGSHFMFGPPEISRLAFYLSGPVSGVLWLPTPNKVNYFPNSSEVLVFVCSVFPLGTLDPKTRTERILPMIPGVVNNASRVLAVGLFDAQGRPQALFLRSDLPPNPDRSSYCPSP